MRIIRLKEVETRTGLKRSTIYRRIQRGLFPMHIKMGTRTSGWIEAEITSWIQQQIETSRHLMKTKGE